MIAVRPLVAALGAGLLLSLGVLASSSSASIAAAAPILAQTDGQPASNSAGPSFPNPLAGLGQMLSPDNLGKLIQDTAAVLLQRMVSGLHDLLLGLTQGDSNVITRTPPTMTYQQPFVTDKHDALLRAMDWGFVAALAVVGFLVILGPSSPLSFPGAVEVVPRLVIAYIAAHSSLQWGAWFIDLSNALCTAVAPADPFPLTSSTDLGTAFALLGLALLYACVARLARRGLVSALPGPADLGKPHQRLLLMSNLGLAVLAWRREVEPAILARAWRLERAQLRDVVGQLPAVLSLYALLGLVAATRRGWAGLSSWSRPGRWCPHSAGAGRARNVTLPAYAALAWEESGSARVEGTYLLVADTGGLSPVALRRQLVGLARLSRTSAKAVPTVVVATTSERRVRAWWVLLDKVASSSTYAVRLHVEVATWESWAARTGVGLPGVNVDSADADDALLAVLQRGDLPRERRPWACVPRPIDVSRVAEEVRRWDLGPRDRIVLDVLGRHPFLADGAIADVLGRKTLWARARRLELVRRGLARVDAPDELRSPMEGTRELVEVTVEGLRLLAGYMGLSLAAGVRHHGLTGGGPMAAVGPRRALLANLAHTLGADAVFAAIARAARTQREGALVEWRNAAACAHGRVRPDGYGLLRLGRREYGFFLEFDRGTVRPALLRAKFAAYHRYRVSARAARDYDGFPTILVVTHGPGAENRVADAVLATDGGQAAPLGVLLTTADLLAHVDGGPFGPIWRTPGYAARACRWPPSGLTVRDA
jgi:hypothetical protein